MRTIEEIKIELTLKKLSGTIGKGDIEGLPKDDDLRTFICSLGSELSFWYAFRIDKEPHEETRRACLSNAFDSYYYALDVDESPHDDTRKACLSSPSFSLHYAKNIDKCYREDTYLSACKNSRFKKEYEEEVLKTFHYGRKNI